MAATTAGSIAEVTIPNLVNFWANINFTKFTKIKDS